MYIGPLIEGQGYQALNINRGTGSVIVSFVSMSITVRVLSPKKVSVVQAENE